MDADQAKALREPFPHSAIGKLPKGGTWLDYVGHAAVTARLLEVDPAWTWEPLALDEHGLPLLDERHNLWIKLTICGVTRLGVGDGKSHKELIGDAIRNAAMRFGVALDLWSKEDLRAIGGESPPETAAEPTEPRKTRPMTRKPPTDTTNAPDAASPAQVRMMGALFTKAGVTDRAARLHMVAKIIGRSVESSKDVTKREASQIIEAMRDDAPDEWPTVQEPPA